MTKISKKIFIIFGLVYFIQSIQALSSLPIFYWLKNDLGLTPLQVTAYGSIISISWLVKPLWAFITDSIAIRGSHRKSYIVLSYIAILIVSIYITINGLTLTSYIVLMFIISLSLAFADVAVDGLMCETGQRLDIADKLQSVQWGAVGAASVITGVAGGYIAANFSINFATGLIGTIVLFGLLYVLFLDKTPERVSKSIYNRGCLTGIKDGLKSKQLWLSIAFLFALWCSPSFGIPLNYYMTDVMGVTKTQMGFLSSVGAVFSLLGAIFYGYICKKISLKRLLVISIIVAAISNFCYLYFPNIKIAFIYQAIFGFSGTICHLTVLSYAAGIVPKNAEAIFFSLLMSILNLASTSSSIAGGWLYPIVGLKALMIISGIFTLVCLFFIPYLKVKERE